jgi:hypothetical protein
MPCDCCWRCCSRRSPCTRTSGIRAGWATARFGIYRNAGGAFDSAPAVPSTRVGDATLQFDSCGAANPEYRFSGGELDGRQGAIPQRALLPRAGCAALGGTVAAPASSERGGVGSRHSGTWYAPATSGQGIEVTIRPDIGDGIVFGGWFTYDPQGQSDDAGAQHWFTLQADLAAAADGSVTLPIYRTTGGGFDGFGSRNTWRVGAATWRVSDCNRSELQYRFDAGELAGAYAGRSGMLQLQRLGDCSAR